MLLGIVLIIFTTNILLGPAFQKEVNKEQYSKSDNHCIDNPNGIITDICGASFDKDKDEFDYIDGEDHHLKETFILSKKQQKFINEDHLNENVEETQQRAVIRTDDSDIFDIWPPEKPIPYVIDKSIGDDGKKAIDGAILDIQRFTCVRFKERNKEDKLFLKFFKGKGCWSYIGMRRDKANDGQKISIGEGCESKGEVIHQIMHAFGFLNEHTREDRDIYVEINWENIIPAKKKYFKINKQFVQNLLESKYDYTSIMHYDRKKFSKNGKDTISIFGCSKRTEKILKIIGQRKGMSAGDKAQINKLFKCSELTQRGMIIDDNLKKDTIALPDINGKNYDCNIE